MSTPGVLFVYMRPKPTLNPDVFHDWYNNEHGPNRLRLPHMFRSGLRFRAVDNLDPGFLAVYDVPDMVDLTTYEYTSLRENRTAREAATIGQVDVDRRFYDEVVSRQSPEFRPYKERDDDAARGTVLVIRHTRLKEGEQCEGEYRRWFEQEHLDMISKIPGWRRSRWFRPSDIDDSGDGTYLALHEYEAENGLGGPEHQAATGTKWRAEVMHNTVESATRRLFKLFYVFTECPRDLASASKMSKDTPGFASADGMTKTYYGPEAKICSYATMKDGLVIPYRLEGSPAPNAPVVAFCNSLLTGLEMWDGFVSMLMTECPSLQILRYDFRGRHKVPQPPQPSTPDILADDLNSLLDALRIPYLHALVGVSLGGVTTVNFALKYPHRLTKFIACDFNVVSSPANTQAWKDRIAMAEKDGGRGIKKLAGVTVGRWFHPTTMQSKATVEWMDDMVAANDVEGFKYGCQALWDYDLRPFLPSCQVPGILVVGEGDGKGALVKAMEGFKGLVGPDGMELRVVPETGHLPMAEDAGAFLKTVKDFLLEGA